MTLDEFFHDQPLSRSIFDALQPRIAAAGPVEMHITKSQVAFYRCHTFAAVWLPEQYLRRKAAPLVLTIYLRHRDSSPRWKQVVEPYPGRFTHHLELYSTGEIDDQVAAWLQAAWSEAGEAPLFKRR